VALAFKLKSLDGVEEAVRALYVEKDGEFHLDVLGLEDTSGLKSALQKERQAAKEARDLAKSIEDKFKDIDPDKVREMMSKLDKDGEAQLIAAGKIDEVVAKRIEKQRAELMKQLEAATAQTEAEKARTAKFSQRVLDNNIRAAAAKAGLHAGAVDDALFRARTMFTIDDDGNAIQLDESGKPVLGKDGKTPFTPAEWLESMKETAPHWFPAGAAGGGATGNRDTGNGKTVKRAVFDAMPLEERSAILKTHKLVD
jgi:hypothetical protein